MMKNLRSVRATIVAFAILCAGEAFAAEEVFSNTGNGNNNWNTGSNWTNNAVPTTGDNVYVTNNLTAGSGSTSKVNTVNFVLNNFVATNSGAGVRHIVIDNARILSSTGTSLLGSNTVLNFGTSSSAGTSITFSNNNLFLSANAKINLFADNSTITVSGNFSNGTDTVIGNLANANTGNNGSVRLLFADSSKIVTNNGLMRFEMPNSSSVGTTGFVLQVGTGAALNTFYNSGTFEARMLNSQTRHWVFSNQLVNAGMLILTNASNNNDTRDLSFNVVGITGTALTNTGSGTIRLVATGSGSDTTDIQLRLAKGWLVNLGTISIRSTVNNNRNNDIILTDTTATFSNALGGQLILENGNADDVRIWANSSVNFGTNLVRGGTLKYQSSDGNNSITLTNGGVITLTGGRLNTDKDTGAKAGAIVNISGGLIQSISGVGTLQANWNSGDSLLTNLSGATLLATNGILVVQHALSQQGTLEVREGGTFIISNRATSVLRDWLNAGTVSLSSSNLTAATIVSGSITNDGTIRGGSVAGTTINQQIINRTGGTLEATNGTFVLSLNPSMLGTVVVRNDGTLQFGSTGNLVITNAGAINFYGGTLRVGEITNLAAATINTVGSSAATLSNRLINLGTLNITNATLTVFGGVTNASSGLINLQSTGTLTGGDITNRGVIAAVTGGNLGRVVNVAGGVIHATNGTLVFLQNPTMQGTLNVSSTAKFDSTVTNAGPGIINLTGGTILANDLVNLGHITGSGLISNGLINSGFIDATNGTLTLTPDLINLAAGIVTNSATIQVDSVSNAGTIAMRGGTLNSGDITNTGTIVGHGTLTGTVLNNGTVAATNGAFRLLGGLINNATLDVTTGTTLTNGAVSVNAGTLLLRGSTLSGSLFNNDGTFIISGTSTNLAQLRNRADGIITNAGSFTILNSTVTNAAGGTFVLAGTFLRVLTDAGATNDFRNEGTFAMNSGTLSVGNFVNTGTFVVAHSGTGTISSPAGNVFSNAGAILVNSGTVLYGGGTIVNTGVLNAGGNGVFGANSGSGFTNAGSGLIINATATLGLQAAADLFGNSGQIIVSNGAALNMQNTTGTGTRWNNQGTVTLVNGVLNTGTLNNNGTLIANNSTINMQVSSGTTRPFVQVASGQLIVTNGGDLTITHLANDRLSLNGGTLAVGNGSTFRAFTDIAGQTNAILLNGANIALKGGTIISANVTNSSGATIAGFGTLSFANGPLSSTGRLFNNGTILATGNSPLVLTGNWLFNQTNGTISANNGRLLVTGVLTNQGTISFLNSVGTFNSAVVNAGAWITDPTTNVFQSTHTVLAGGSVAMTSGDVFVFTNNATEVGSFLNLSTQSNTFNTAAGKFVFNTTLALTQQFAVAGNNIGNLDVDGDFNLVSNTSFTAQYQANFALGTLELADTSTLLVFDSALLGGRSHGGLQAALFLNDLTLAAGAQLVISNNVQVYFINSNAFAQSQVTLLGNAGLHQLITTASEVAVVPEPSILMFFLTGGLVLVAYRRRKSRSA